MKMLRYRAVLAFVVGALCMASCSEEDDAVEEFPNWRVQNETYFEQRSVEILQMLEAAPGRTDVKRIKSWSKADAMEGTNTDYILVEVLEEGDPAQSSPLYTDTVSVHYFGRLLPSTTYTSGYVFTQSFYGEYNADVSKPQSMAIGNSSGNALIDGFATALQYMHRGDHWRVYIPHQLGYGSRAQTYIPAYSTLIFDIRLVDFWSPTL